MSDFWFWLDLSKGLLAAATLVCFFVQLFRGRISLKSLRSGRWQV